MLLGLVREFGVQSDAGKFEYMGFPEPLFPEPLTRLSEGRTTYLVPATRIFCRACLPSNQHGKADALWRTPVFAVFLL